MAKSKQNHLPTFQELLQAKHTELTGVATERVEKAAERLEVSKATIYNFISGRSTPKAVQMSVLAEIYGLNEKEVAHEA